MTKRLKFGLDQIKAADGYNHVVVSPQGTIVFRAKHFLDAQFEQERRNEGRVLVIGGRSA